MRSARGLSRDQLGCLCSGFAQLDTALVIKGALFFDTSAILYTNALYALLMLLPVPYKERAGWQSVCKWLYVVINGVGVA